MIGFLLKFSIFFTLAFFVMTIPYKNATVFEVLESKYHRPIDSFWGKIRKVFYENLPNKSELSKILDSTPSAMPTKDLSLADFREREPEHGDEDSLEITQDDNFMENNEEMALSDHEKINQKDNIITDKVANRLSKDQPHQGEKKR